MKEGNNKIKPFHTVNLFYIKYIEVAFIIM